MKHQFVDATLLSSERIAPFAALAEPDPEPLEGPTRLPCTATDTGCGVIVIEYASLRDAVRAAREELEMRTAAE